MKTISYKKNNYVSSVSPKQSLETFSYSEYVLSQEKERQMHTKIKS